MAATPTIARRAGNSGFWARQGASLGTGFSSALSVTVTPLFNRIVVQVDLDSVILAGTTIEGEVDYCAADGVWRAGTVLLKRYDAEEYYANCFNLREDTYYDVMVTVRLRSDATGLVVREFRDGFATTTLSSETPQSGGTVYYLDPVNGNNANSGLTPLLPKKWLNAVSWAAGDTIVLMNGDFSAAAGVSERAITGRAGTATNWIRVVPYNKYSPGSGDDDTESFRKQVSLNGPWTETSGGSGVWSMSTALNIGVVRDETTGIQLYHHNSLSDVSDTEPGITVGFDPADFPQFGGDEVQGWFINTATDTIYIRTDDGLEPAADRFVGGYVTGITIRNSSYIWLDRLRAEMCLNVTNSTTMGSNSGLRVDATSGGECHHIYLKQCELQDTNVRLVADLATTATVHHILFDDCTWRRKGPKEIFLDRCAYTEADPYDADLGYHPVKAALWDMPAVHNSGASHVVIRGADCVGFDLYTNFGVTADSWAALDSGKNVDIYSGSASGNVVGQIDFTNSAGVEGVNINAAVWDMVLDDGAEPVAMSPVNSGPIWFLANRGDGFLHVPFKIGVQEGPTYSDADGNGFKVIANNSFACRGYVTSETHGNLRFQTGFSGVLAYNNVVKGYAAKEPTPSGYWFVYCASPVTVVADRVNQWLNGIVYIVSTVVSPQRPEIYWDNVSYDIAADPDDKPTEAEIVFTGTAFGWSGESTPDPDPFLTTVEAGLNPAITTKSVYVRGITDLASATDGGGRLVLSELPLGHFQLQEQA